MRYAKYPSAYTLKLRHKGNIYTNCKWSPTITRHFVFACLRLQKSCWVLTAKRRHRLTTCYSLNEAERLIVIRESTSKSKVVVKNLS